MMKYTQAAHCQPGDNEFTVVIVPPQSSPTEASYRTVCQKVVAERVQLKRVIELENCIFVKAFHLIQTYYRPISSGKVSSSAAYVKRKSRHSDDSLNVYNSFKLPRKRISGLVKAYKTEYEARMKKLDRMVDSVHRDAIDWQVVFSFITNYPTDGNLAKELNYDSLFDYEDAIGLTAMLLGNARQQCSLLDGLILSHAPTSQPSPNVAYNGAEDFEKLLQQVQKLINIKKNQLDSIRDKQNHKGRGWFCLESKEEVAEANIGSGQPNVADIENELNAWEEFVDIVGIL